MDRSEFVEARMKKLLLTVIFTAMLVSLAEAQQVPDPRVTDLVRAGKIRVGMHSMSECTPLCTQRIPERVS
jgi:hypothetical protein